MPLNVSTTRDRLQKFEFANLFVEELGWSHPKLRQAVASQLSTKNSPHLRYTRTPIAQLAGVVVFEVTAGDGIPDAKVRAAIQKQVAEEHVENLLIFLDPNRTQSLWYWVKRESGKAHPRDHLYVKGQPGDLFLSKLAAMVVDISELDAEGNITVTEVANRLKSALDVERVTKRFYGEFDTQRLEFIEHIHGIDDEHQRRWYASVLMNRLMFIWFLQKKGFLDGADRDYLTNKLAASKKRGGDKFFSVFLKALFFEGFAKPELARSPDVRALLGKIRYLNGGLFLPHRVELDHGFLDKPRIKIPDVAFENIFRLFRDYSWNLNDTPGGDDKEINPDVLGYIFEKYINQKEFGAYYTRPEMTGYLCERTIYKLVLDKINARSGDALPRRHFATISDLLLNLDARLCRALLFEILPSLRLLDPACGSAAFLVAAMKVLITIYSAVIGKIQFLNDAELTKWLKQTQIEHPSVLYFIKKQIITNNLFGVDIMEEATEIARLRLFLALVASAQTEDQLEPLPNIDFNILAGNSLIGLLHVDPAKFDAGQSKNAGAQERMTLQHGSDLGFTIETKTAPTKEERVVAFIAQQNAARFAAILEDKNKSIELYRKHAFQPGEKDGLTQEERLIQLRSHIENVRAQSYARLNQMLLDEFNALGIQFEQATWDDRKNDVGRPEKRRLKSSDIEALYPFHWGYEFDKVMADGGFDGIITNPPWESVEPHAREFFAEHSELVTKNKMTIKEFEKEQAKLLKNPDVREAWLEFQSRFPHVRDYFRMARQFENQITIINGKRQGKDINLYKLFVEQCYRLLRGGGDCGIVIPSGIYTDLGAMGLRTLLFDRAQISGLFGFENREEIFENVDTRFKFVVLTFQRGGATTEFPVAFMRRHVEELRHFPGPHSLRLTTKLIRQLSEDSLSLMEFKAPADIAIAQKLFRFPALGRMDSPGWHVKLRREFNMTDDAGFLHTSSGPKRLPLFTGKMFHQFEMTKEHSGYWMDEKAGRKALIGRDVDCGQVLDYQRYRWVFRRIARNTDSRTFITTIAPRNVFTEVNSPSIDLSLSRISEPEMVALCAIANSFALDWFLRLKVTTTLNFFYIEQLPVPRLTTADPEFAPIVQRAAQLICTTPEFDALAKEVSVALKLPLATVKGATDDATRARLRAELDALIAHLYGLTEDEFRYILTTFPLVSDSVKSATLDEYRTLAQSAAPARQDAAQINSRTKSIAVEDAR